MDQGQPISMIEPSHPAVNVAPAEAPKRRNIAPFIVIGVCVLLLGVLAIVLATVVKRGGKSTTYEVDYLGTYDCSTDQYNFMEKQVEFKLSFENNNGFKLSEADDTYSSGDYRETNQTRTVSEDGAREVNYYLMLKTKKNVLEGEDITEASDYEEEYILNFNENSDAVVFTNKEDNITYYCRKN